MLRRPLLGLGIRLLVLCVALRAVPGAFARAAGPEVAAAPAQAGHGAPHEPAPASAGHAEGGHGEAAGKTNPMEIQPSLALWTFVVFVGLAFVLGKFAWGPLIGALHQREEHLEHCLLQTEKARNESEQLLAEHRRLMALADERVRALLDKAQAEASARGEEIVRLAQSEAEASRDRAQRDIATARDQALVDIWGQAANVAVSVAGRVLSKQLSEDEHRRLLDSAIRELPETPAAANGHGGGLS